MRPLATAIALSAAALGFGQADMVGKDLFPQFRNLGGLPGNMIPVGPDGTPSYAGALSLSTPTAYTLSGWHGIAGYGSMSFDMRFRSPRGREGQKTTNGTAQFMLGTSAGSLGTVSGGFMVLSNLGDNAFNLQWSPGRQVGKSRYAIGVQDLNGGGGSAGEGQPTDGDSSRSFYGVTTYQIDDKTHVSVGTGTRRFKGVFGNISTTVMPNLKACLEYDTFNWNVGVSYRILALQRMRPESYDATARYAELHAFLGVVRGKYLMWGMGVSF